MIDALQAYVAWAWDVAEAAAFYNPILLLAYGVEIFLALISPLLALAVVVMALPFAAVSGWRAAR